MDKLQTIDRELLETTTGGFVDPCKSLGMSLGRQAGKAFPANGRRLDAQKHDQAVDAFTNANVKACESLAKKGIIQPGLF